MSPKKNILVLATRNKGKVREMADLLQGLDLEVKGMEAFPQIGEIPETGHTFLENARLKAQVVHQVAGGYVLADDSGLECEDLKGWPGIYSARFAGPNATDEDNNRKLLEDLKAVHDPSRIARYVCALILLDPAGKETAVQETCEGVITFTPGGTGGFGYDPYFFLPDRKCTMAELPLDEKNKISHRGKALRKIKEELQKSANP